MESQEQGQTQTTNPAVPKVVQDVLDSLARDSANCLTHIEKLRPHAAFVAMVQDHAPEGAYYYIGSWNVNSLDVTIPVTGFTSEAEPALAEFLEWLSELYETEPTSHDNPDAARRSYTFNPGEGQMGVTVEAALVEGGEACQRIITGTRKVERSVYVEVDEPVYAFRC